MTIDEALERISHFVHYVDLEGHIHTIGGCEPPAEVIARLEAAGYGTGGRGVAAIYRRAAGETGGDAGARWQAGVRESVCREAEGGGAAAKEKYQNLRNTLKSLFLRG